MSYLDYYNNSNAYVYAPTLERIHSGDFFNVPENFVAAKGLVQDDSTPAQQQYYSQDVYQPQNTPVVVSTPTVQQVAVPRRTATPIKREPTPQEAYQQAMQARQAQYNAMRANQARIVRSGGDSYYRRALKQAQAQNSSYNQILTAQRMRYNQMLRNRRGY